MATLDLSKAGSGFDMTDPDLVAFATFGAGSPTEWTYFTPSGHKVTVTGSGMTFDAAGRPTAGTATSIAIDVGNNGSPDLVITGISAAAARLDDSPASFWRFLDGADVILGPESAQGAPNSIYRMFGDGIAARNGVTGGNDIMRAGDRIGSSMGDVAYVGNLTAADYHGGNDEILGLITNAVQYMYGDAGGVYGGSRLTGGDDTILIQSTSTFAAASGDAAEIRTFNGAVARLVGGDDYMTAGLYFKGELAGDVLHQESNTSVQGADTINGGGFGELISGDVGTMKGSPTAVARLIGGNDTINGNGGDDVIAGDLRLNAAPGITVTGGDDTIDGGAGNDTISGDVYSAYPGVRSITGGDDVIRGGAGNDLIFGDSTDNNQNAVGIGGDDRLYGEDGDDRIYGHGGNDTLDGGAGVDQLRAGDGDDWLSGGSGNDIMEGGAGNDQMDGGSGDDTMYGGLGNDTYYVNSFADRVLEAAGAGIDIVWSTLASTYLTDDVENLSYNGVGSFLGIGNGLANIISGSAGTDTLNGGDGNDVLIGGAGADAMVGGNGIDTASYATATVTGVDARLTGSSPNFGGDARGDTYSGIENLTGSVFADNLSGDDAANTLNGGDGGDNLFGYGGDDRLNGGAGDDRLLAKEGNDVLRGGLGADVLRGGAGDDVFDFDSVSESAPGARDIIAEDVAPAFEGAGVAGGDVVDLRGIDANTGAGGNQAFVFGGTGRGQLSLIESAGNTLVRANTDGDAAFEFELLIEDGAILASAYRAGDFIL